MTQKLIPGFVDAVAAYLTTNLPAVIDAEEALWGDGIVMAPFTEIVKSDPDQLERLTTPPYLYCFVDSARIFDWRTGYEMFEAQLVLWAVIQETTPALLRLKQGRYGNVLFKALVALAMSQDAYSMSGAEEPFASDLNYGMTLTQGEMAMNDVRLETRWTVTER